MLDFILSIFVVSLFSPQMRYSCIMTVAFIVFGIIAKGGQYFVIVHFMKYNILQVKIFMFCTDAGKTPFNTASGPT
jgi:hypothetical protein